MTQTRYIWLYIDIFFKFNIIIYDYLHDKGSIISNYFITMMINYDDDYLKKLTLNYVTLPTSQANEIIINNTI